MSEAPVLSVQGLTVTFGGRSGRQAAVDDVSLDVAAGETVGLVGGSGAGKSTIARAVAGLVTPDAGRILLDGAEVTSSAGRRRASRAMHLIFQDPYSSLPPTLSVAEVVGEPLVIHRIAGSDERRELVAAALASVHLTPVHSYLTRYPHQLSGGQRQRVAIARALVTGPRLLLADEPTQMLDPTLRGELVDVLSELRDDRGLAVLHITHDLALAQRGCDRLVVLRQGRVVEHGRTSSVLDGPRHSYTAALVQAARRLHPG